MNKNEIINMISDKSGLSKVESGKALDAFIATVETVLKKGDDIRLIGFGTFSVTKRAASTGKNPRTGEAIKIPASNRPKFKVGKGLIDALN